MTAALPDAKLTVGVKVAVYTLVSVEDTASALRAPPVVVMSARTKLLTGSSLKVKVMVAVCPTFRVAPLTRLLDIARVGATVSMAMTGVAPAPPELPAASV